MGKYDLLGLHGSIGVALTIASIATTVDHGICITPAIHIDTRCLAHHGCRKVICADVEKIFRKVPIPEFGDT